jgi:hypothetical protein
LKLIYATIAKPSSETTQNREKEFLHYSSRKEGIEKHDKEACWNLSVARALYSAHCFSSVALKNPKETFEFQETTESFGTASHT